MAPIEFCFVLIHIFSYIKQITDCLRLRVFLAKQTKISFKALDEMLIELKAIEQTSLKQIVIIKRERQIVKDIPKSRLYFSS